LFAVAEEARQAGKKCAGGREICSTGKAACGQKKNYRGGASILQDVIYLMTVSPGKEGREGSRAAVPQGMYGAS